MNDTSINLFPTPVLKCTDVLDKSEIDSIFNILKNKHTVAHHVVPRGKSSHHPSNKENILQTLGIEERLQEKLDVYTNRLGIGKVSILSSWFNIQDIGSILKLHMHTKSLLSAALYVNVDENSSPLFFYNPNPLTHYSFSIHKGNRPEFNMHHTQFKPKNGELYIFPSWLLHGSDDLENKTPDRTVISLNAG